MNFGEYFVGNVGNLSFLTINVRSLSGKFPEFQLFLERLKFKFTFIFLTEVWLSDATDVGFQLSGYHSVSVNRNDLGGGIKLYYAEYLQVTKIETLTGVFPSHEALFIKTKIPGCFTITLAGIYRPPNCCADSFIDYLENSILNYDLCNCVLLGDFNFDFLKVSTDFRISRFVEIMQTNGFQQCITKPTYFNSVSRSPTTILDHIWHNLNITFNSNVIYPPLSDHFACSTIFNTKLSDSNRVTLRFRNFSLQNKVKFHANIENEFELATLNMTDINTVVYSFNCWLTYLLNKYFPIKVKTVSEKRNMQPWMTSSIIKCIKIKHKLFKQFQRGEINYCVYKTYSSLLKTLLIIAERRYRRKKVANLRGNMRSVYQIINNMLGKGVSRVCNRISINGSIETDGEKIANAFAEYFENEPLRIQTNIVPYNAEDMLSFIPLNNNSCFFIPTNEWEVCDILTSIKGSNGLKDIPVKFLKLSPFIFSTFIADIYNLSLQTAEYPDLFKVARIVPVFKSGNKVLIENYRPISVLPILNKIFEKLTFKRMYSFITRYKLLSKSQFGFRVGSNTERAVLNFIAAVLPVFLKKEYALAIFVDFRKAFDTIDRNILLSKLDRYGFRDRALKYLESYLSQRSSSVDYEGVMSHKVTSRTGVPQGSCLGPLMFNLYINDLIYYLHETCTFLYADDSTFLKMGSNLQALSEEANQVLQRLHKWSSFNRLAVNTSKTKFMILTNLSIADYPVLTFNRSQLDNVTDFRYLGLFIDSHLKFSNHYDKLAGKMSSFCGVTYRLKHLFDFHTAKLFYFSNIFSIMSYSILAWGGLLDTQRGKRLQRLQNKIVFNLFSRFSPSPNISDLYRNLSLLTLKNVYKLKVGLTMYKMFNEDFLPEIKDVILEPNIPNFYNTRQNNHLRLPFPRVNSIKYNFTYQFILTWNSIPDYIKLSPSSNKFKKLYTNYLLNRLD